MVVHHSTKFGHKRLHTNTQPTVNKYLSRALQPILLKTPQCVYFCSQIIHYMQKGVKHCCCKSADVDSYIRVGWKSVLLTETVLLCAHMLHHFNTPHKPHLKKWLIYFVSTLISSNKHNFFFLNNVKCGHLPSRWKKSSLVSVVNKLQYCDTHPEDSTGNKRDTDCLFCV